MFSVVLILSLLTTAAKAKEHGVFFKVEENHVLLDENNLWEETVESLLRCSQMCARMEDCKAANFKEDQGKCSLLGEGKTRHPKNLLKRTGYFYFEKVNYSCIYLQLSSLKTFCD